MTAQGSCLDFPMNMNKGSLDCVWLFPHVAWEQEVVLRDETQRTQKIPLLGALFRTMGQKLGDSAADPHEHLHCPSNAWARQAPHGVTVRWEVVLYLELHPPALLQL